MLEEVDADAATAVGAATTVPLSITTSSLSGATVGQVYQGALAAKGGKPPYTWSVASGSTLPAGLNLTGAGAISGTPSGAGLFPVPLTVTDHASATATATVSILVSSAPVTGLSSSATATTVTLRWLNPTGVGFAGVLVRRTVGTTPPPSPTAGTPVADVATPGLTVTDSGLTANTVYSYALFAHDAASHYSVPSTTTTTTGGGPNPSWILADWAAEKLQNYGLSSAQLSYFFNNPGTELNVHGNLPQVLAELPNATRFQDFTSFATMEAAFQTGAILPGVTAIMYDNERWSKTPVIEQQNPVAYATQAENLVHSHGMRFILTFAADVAPGSGTKYQRYLNDNLAGQGAHISDVFDIQAQQAEGTTEFQPFAAQAIAQAHAGNPACVVLVGIGSAPNGVTVTPSQILNDYQSVRTGTDGYWLNDAGQTSVDVSFLQLLAASQEQ